MRDKTVATLVLLTFIGMAGLWYILWRVYQQYQATTAQGSAAGRVLGVLGAFTQ